MPTEVTCRDTTTGESETRTINDDFVITVDGQYVIHNVQMYANGTYVVTLKKAPRELAVKL